MYWRGTMCFLAHQKWNIWINKFIFFVYNACNQTPRYGCTLARVCNSVPTVLCECLCHSLNLNVKRVALCGIKYVLVRTLPYQAQSRLSILGAFIIYWQLNLRWRGGTYIYLPTFFFIDRCCIDFVFHFQL